MVIDEIVASNCARIGHTVFSGCSHCVSISARKHSTSGLFRLRIGVDFLTKCVFQRVVVGRSRRM